MRWGPDKAPVTHHRLKPSSNPESQISLPDPLVPPEVDLSGLTFMPLDVQRLRDSDLVSEVSPAEFRAAVLLWCAAWHQVPAASLPDKDATLARMAGFGQSQSELRAWGKVRNGALRGFVLCSDGRLYHPVVAEKALEAWAERREYQSAREGEAARKRRERQWRAAAAELLRNNGIVPDFNATTAELRRLVSGIGYTIVVDDDGSVSVKCQRDESGDVTRTSGDRVTAKKRREEKWSEEKRSGEERRGDINTARAAEDTNSPEAQLAAVLAAAAGKQVAAADPEVLRAVAQGVTRAELEAACAGAPQGKPPRYYVQRALGRRADALASGPAPAPAAPPPDPEEAARAERRRQLEDEIIDVRHCAERGIGGWTPKSANARITELRNELASLAGEVA